MSHLTLVLSNLLFMVAKKSTWYTLQCPWEASIEPPPPRPPPPPQLTPGSLPSIHYCTYYEHHIREGMNVGNLNHALRLWTFPPVPKNIPFGSSLAYHNQRKNQFSLLLPPLRTPEECYLIDSYFGSRHWRWYWIYPQAPNCKQLLDEVFVISRII